MPYAPGASERFHRNNSPASEGTGSSALTGRAVILISLTPYREKRFSAQVRACSFPVDLKPQLAEVPKHQVPVIAQLFSGLGQNEPIVEIVEDPDAHFL